MIKNPIKLLKVILVALKSKACIVLSIEDEFTHSTSIGGEYTIDDCIRACSTYASLLKRIAEKHLKENQEILEVKRQALVGFSKSLGISENFMTEVMVNAKKDNV